MGHVISIANQKGGVGKTTATFNLGTALSRDFGRVLLIDNDPQANLTSYATTERQFSKTIDEVYLGREKSPLVESDLYRVSDSLFLLPSDSLLSGVEYYLVSRAQRELVLKTGIAPLVASFDFILIDNPPSLNLLTLNGLVASDSVLVPVQPEFFSLEGLTQLNSTLEDLQKWHPVRLLGLFANMYDNRRRLNQEVWDALKQTYGERLLETKIHNSVKVPESAGYGKSIVSYAPKSRPAQEYAQLAKEVARTLSTTT